MSNILDTIAAKTKERMAEEEALVSTETLKQQAWALAERQLEENGGSFPFPFEAALSGDSLGFICEVKKASPSKGVIAQDFPYLQIACEYEVAGADAISCLTEPYWFLGKDEYLQEIASTVSIPVLRKDFVVCERMVYQAKVLGASAVLLIAAILDDGQLASYFKIADELGLSCLFEAHDAAEVARCVAAGARVIGVNNRNLKDFTVDFENSARLRSLIPEGVIYVAESGVSEAMDVSEVASNGADAVLIGEALMRAEDKLETLASFKACAAAGAVMGRFRAALDAKGVGSHDQVSVDDIMGIMSDIGLPMEITEEGTVIPTSSLEGLFEPAVNVCEGSSNAAEGEPSAVTGEEGGGL